jgi:molybdopterin/thiamine biosynthesis adenylyltransferase
MSLVSSDSRYLRQVAVPEYGEATQQLLEHATIALVGCGALGGLQAELLTRMGVGELRFADFDVVSLMNLHRQILYTEEDVEQRRAKIDAALAKLSTLNRAVRLVALNEKVTAQNINGYLAGATVVLDATDNIETRFLINDWCVAQKVPWVYTGVAGTSGMILPVVPGGPCLRCFYPEVPETDAIAHPNKDGVLSTTVAMAVSLQVTQLLKILNKTVQAGDLIRFNVWEPSVKRLKLAKNTACSCCNL